MSDQPNLKIPPVEVQQNYCAHCPNHPDYVRWKNEQYREQAKQMAEDLIKSCPESLRGIDASGAWQIVDDKNHEKSLWRTLSDEEKEWLKRCLVADLMNRLHYIGQLPPCTLKMPTFVDHDFHFLYQHSTIHVPEKENQDGENKTSEA